MSVRSTLVRKVIATELYSMEEIFSMKGRVYTFLNPVSYLIAVKNKQLYAPFDGIFADGSLFVGAIFLLYHHVVSRRSFDMTSVAPMLFENADANKKRVSIIATKQDVLEIAIDKLSKVYPNIKWVECRNGFFENEIEMQEEAKRIADADSDFLIVGMGARMQEKFLLMCRNAGYHGVGFTCGGFIHQYAMNKTTDYYPKWINKLNIRFLYRMYKEPHTRMRYATAAIQFPYAFIKEKMMSYFLDEK